MVIYCRQHHWTQEVWTYTTHSQESEDVIVTFLITVVVQSENFLESNQWNTEWGECSCTTVPTDYLNLQGIPTEKMICRWYFAILPLFCLISLCRFYPPFHSSHWRTESRSTCQVSQTVTTRLHELSSNYLLTNETFLFLRKVQGICSLFSVIGTSYRYKLIIIWSIGNFILQNTHL